MSANKVLRAALYARYSVEKKGETRESIADQFRVCRELAAREGFDVTAQFKDAGISGGTKNRPGYQDLLTSARRREFDVIVAEDSSRLWRNMTEQAPRLAELADLSMPVVTLDLDTRHASAGVMAAVKGVMNEEYRREISRRVRRGMDGLALAGKSTGGICYGYSGLAIVPEQAVVVRRIFTLYADGHSPRRIASLLNADGIPSARGRQWMATTIAGMLRNPRYVGRYTWGSTRVQRSFADSSTIRYVPQKAALVERSDERLRIVKQELWARVEKRVKAQFLDTRGKGRPARHPLSGLLFCGVCGGRYSIVSKRLYGCTKRLQGDACPNRRLISKSKIEAALFDAMANHLLTPEMEAGVMRQARKLITEQRTNARANEKALGTRRKDLETRIANLTDAIESGALRASPAIGAKLAEAEAELAALAIPEPKRGAEIIDLLPGAIPVYRRMMRDLPGLVAKDPDRAREQLRRYFPRIVLKPTREEGIVAILNLTAEQLLEMVDCTVRIGSPLRSYTHGASSVGAAGATVAEVLADLDRRYPGMRFRMIDEQDRIRRHIRVFVDDREAATLAEPVTGGDQIHLICALSGG